MARKEFTATVKKEIILRSKGFCEGCGVAIKKRKGQVDHILADGLVVTKKDLTAEDGKHLCIPCHVMKTGEDIKKIAKANRNFKKDNGLTRKKKPIPSQGFPKAGKKPRIQKQEVKRQRPLYRSVS